MYENVAVWICVISSPHALTWLLLLLSLLVCFTALENTIWNFNVRNLILAEGGLSKVEYRLSDSPFCKVSTFLVICKFYIMLNAPPHGHFYQCLFIFFFFFFTFVFLYLVMHLTYYVYLYINNVYELYLLYTTVDIKHLGQKQISSGWIKFYLIIYFLSYCFEIDVWH